MSEATAILRGALELPVHQRADLAFQLLESLDAEPEENVEAAWAAEVTRRVESLRRGEARTRPVADAFRDARRQLATRQ